MSNPTAPGQAPDLNSSRPDPFDSDQRDQTSDTFSDPPLQSGSFVASSNNFSTSGQTTIQSNRDNHQASPARAPAPLLSSSANGVETGTPPVKSRRKVPVTMSPGAVESASWLPPGWLIEDRVRSSGATAGTVDKYYIEPITGRKFRSKKEVQYYLETGTVKRKKRGTESSEADVNPLESSGNHKKAGKNSKGFEMKFDHLNVPDSVEWVLTNANDDVWTPFIGGVRVSEYDQQSWEFEMLHPRR